MTETVDETIVDMVAAGAFGPDSRLVSFELERQHTEQNQFASCVSYGTATVDDRDGQRHKHRLVLKFKHPTEQMRDLFNNDSQFHNEKLFYERIAPFLLAHGSRLNDDGLATPPSLCRYFYGRNDCSAQVQRDVIVLENESVRGYRSVVTDHSLCLDFDHLIVALRTLAKFHGISYRAKHEDSVKFKEAVADVKDIQWSENGEWIFNIVVIQGLISVAVDKMNESYAGCVDNEVEWMRQFQSELLADVIQTMRRMTTPVEPQAVLCHGDFNRNNLLFRYDENDRPVDALAFDMAAIQYGSPVIDLSLFLYLNTDRQTREDHWDALLDAYCETLASAAGDVPVPGREQLDAEFREYGFYGLIHVSYFARVMLDEAQNMDVQQFLDFNDHLQQLQFFLLKGGDRATEWIADAIQHFIRCKYGNTSATVSAANDVGTPIKF